MKRKLSFFLAFALVIMSCVGVASAASIITPFASPTLYRYNAEMFDGLNSGEVEITFDVLAKGTVTTCGISSIQIYEANGTRVATITGTIANGLLVSGHNHGGSYIYDGNSGTSYYAKVTFYAGNSSVSDTGIFTTGIATAP